MMTQSKDLIRRLLGLLLVALIVVPVGCSKQTEAEKAAVSIVKKNLAARGGLEKWRAIKSMTMSGQMDAGKIRSADDVRASMQPQASAVSARRAVIKKLKSADPEDKTVRLPYVMEVERPRKMRLEITFQGQTAVQVYDGTHGWKLRPFLGRHEVETYTADELKLASEQQELDGPLIDYARKGNQVELEGTEPVEGRDAYKIKVTLKDGQVRHVWLDKDNYLDVKVDGTRRMDGKPRAVSTYLRDYKSVNGLMIPHVMETSVEGVSGSEKIVVEKVAINTPIDDARFGKPR